MYPAIFFDRDGVLIDNVDNYVRTWYDVVIYSGVPEALACLGATPYRIIIVTNQSVIGRGIISLKTAQEINERLISSIRQTGGRIDAIFMCPHTPEEDCQCRKPKPGLILQAATDLCLDLTRSIMVGDGLSDLMAGQAAGIPINILVRTGRGENQANLPEAASLKHYYIYDKVQDVIQDILSGEINP
jgi:D-glycero-D-manno-heptose 1,7-bisphosphate phosphatase